MDDSDYYHRRTPYSYENDDETWNDGVTLWANESKIDTENIIVIHCLNLKSSKVRSHYNEISCNSTMIMAQFITQLSL